MGLGKFALTLATTLSPDKAVKAWDELVDEYSQPVRSTLTALFEDEPVDSGIDLEELGPLIVAMRDEKLGAGWTQQDAFGQVFFDLMVACRDDYSLSMEQFMQVAAFSCVVFWEYSALESTNGSS